MESPRERAVAELFVLRDLLSRSELRGSLTGLDRAVCRIVKASVVVLFRGTAAFYPYTGVGQRQERCPDRDRLSFSFKADGIRRALPVGDIEPAAAAVCLYRCVEFYINLIIVVFTAGGLSELRIDPEDRPQRNKPIRQHGADAVLIDAVGHDELFDLHSGSFILDNPPFSVLVRPTGLEPARVSTGT